jgi:hypothetical protein
MAYQKPRADHPWKTGRMPGYVPREEKKVKPVRVLISELASSWDHIEVLTYHSSREGKFFLIDLPQSKQAAWLAGLLKRNYESL